MNLSKCQIFTPPDIVKYMLNTVEYSENIFGKRIVDNSCGSGNILVEVVQRFIDDAKKHKKRKATIKKGLENCIFGYDIDPQMVKNCIENLNKVASSAGLFDIQWNIFCEDGLYINDNAFDYVVGNPPYIAYSDLDEITRKKTKENFRSCAFGKFDYSYAFIEKGLTILSMGGKMVMLTPSNMFKTVYGATLRNIIKNELNAIIDCSTLNMFENVLTSPAITVFKKGSNSNILIYRDKFFNNVESEKLIDKDSLIDKWDFTGFVEKGERRFGDYFKVSNCIATLANKVYIHTVNENGSLPVDIEEGILRVAKSPKTEQYHICQKIIFPYKYMGEQLIRYKDEELKVQFEKTYRYLLSQKAILKERDSDKGAEWFEYGRSQALAHLNREKLLMSTIITHKVRLYKLDPLTIPYSGLYIIPKRYLTLDTAQTVLESQHFFNYLLSIGVKERGESIRISSKDVENYKF